MDKVLSQLRYIDYPPMRIGNADHGFGRMNRYGAELLEFDNEMVE